MKIAFLSFYSGEVYRGVETYVHELGNSLVVLGHDITVFQNGPKIKGSKYNTVSTGLSVDWRKPGGKFRFYIDYWARKVGKFTQQVLGMMSSDTDVVITTNAGWPSPLCRLWTWRNKARLVIPGQSGPGIDDRLNLWVFPDTFIGLTNHQSKWAKRANPFIKTKTIPNGVDLTVFKPGGEQLSLDLEKPVVLSVSALTPPKRLALAIRAVSQMKHGSLLLVGKGELEHSLRKLGDELLPGRFKIMSLAHKDIPKVYRAADLFTFSTSPWESFGIVLVEAMAIGLPVVASDDPIRAEIVGGAGILVDPTNTQAYTQALEDALKKDWGDKPRRQAEKFSWDKIAKEYENLFKEIVQ